MSCFWKDLQQTTCAPTPIPVATSFSLYGAGANSLYEDSGSGNVNVFTAVAAHTDIVDIACGLGLSFLLDDSGVTKGIGDAFSNELKTGGFGTETTYVNVQTAIAKIFGGRETLLAIGTDGNLEATGDFFGSGTHNEGDWDTAASGGYFWHAINTSEEIHAEGENGFGQLGNGTTVTPPTRTAFALITSSYVKISCGDEDGHVLALTSTGDLYATGRNDVGQLGINSFVDKDVFTLVGSGYTDICAGAKHSLALKTNGDLMSCGDNSNGQLGIAVADTTDRDVFTLAGTGFAKLPKCLTASNSSFAIKINGDLYATGLNTNGWLGLGDTTQREDFTLVGSGFSEIAAGSAHAIALK